VGVLGGKAEGTFTGWGVSHCVAVLCVKARGACGVPFDMYPRGGDESGSYV